MSKNDDLTIKDLLTEAKVDLEYVQDNLSESAEDMEKALKDASKKLKKNLEKLAKKAKNEVKSEVLNFYHDNKQVANADLKTINSYVKEISGGVKEYLIEAIDETDDKDERAALKEVRSKVKKLSRRYNRKYAMLKIKLAVGSAEVDIKNFFNDTLI